MDLTFRGTDPVPNEDPTWAPPPPSPLVAPRGPAASEARASAGWRAAAVAVLAIGVVVRFVAASHLWLDEALTVNIAHLPLGQLTEALRLDGAPPLYYVLLHGWTSVFGTGTVAVRILPGLFGVTALPLMWFAARRVGGERVAWAATLLLAAGPFAVRYATEARMYSLVTVLVLVGFLAVMAVFDGGGAKPAVVLALTTGALLLTHYWSFYLLAVVVAALAIAVRRGKPGARPALVAVGAGCLLFLPWAPVFLDQLKHTGTPWGQPGSLRSVFDTVIDFGGGYWDAGIPLGLMFFGLAGLALFGTAVDGGRVLFDWRARPPANWVAPVAFGTLAVALVAGIVSRSAFAVRYAAVMYPTFIIVVALGTEALVDRRVFNGVLAVAVALGLWAIVPNVVGERTSAAKVATFLTANSRPGDVVGYCPDQLGPSVNRSLGAEGANLVQLTFPRAASPERVDWRDYAKVNKAGRPADFANLLLQRAGPDHDVWLVWAPGYRTVAGKCQNIIDVLARARPDNLRVVKVSTAYFERPGLVRFRPSLTG